MIQTIIDYLNLRVETLGRIAHLYGITEKRKRSGDDAAIPYAYVGAGQFEPVDIDNGNAGWWRPRSGFTMEPVEVIGRAVKQQRASYPLRFVVVLRRDLSVADDAFMPSRLAEDISNALNFDNGDLRNILRALNVEARTSSVEFDASAIWATEFHTSIPDLNYELAMVAVDVTVEVVAKYSCWEGECATDLDILRLFNFCDPSVVARLSPTQVACLEAAICPTPPTLCEQLAAIEPAEVVADVFDCLTEAAQDELLSTECSDGTVNITNTDADPIATVTVASGGVEPYVIPNVAWTDSDGSAESTPYGAAITCTPAMTVALAVSNASPFVGDVITITATPTNFTPTSYQFRIEYGTNLALIVTQAGNTYNWTVPAPIGTYTVYVLATDGSNNLYKSESVTIQSSYLLDAYPTNNLTDFSTFRLKQTFNTRLMELRRTVGATTTAVEIGLDGNYVTLNSPVLAVTTGSSTAVTLGQFVAATGYANPDGIAANQSAFVVRTYRQANGTLGGVQTTAVNQPRLVNAGVLDVESGVACLIFSGNQSLDFGTINGGNKAPDYSLLGVGRILGGATSMKWCASGFGGATVNAYLDVFNRNIRPNQYETQYSVSPSSSTNSYVGGSTSSVFNNSQQLFEQHKTSGTPRIDLHVNGGAALAMADYFGTSGQSNGGVESSFSLGRGGADPLDYLTGSAQMLVVYNSNQTANRLTMKTLINNLLGTSW